MELEAASLHSIIICNDIPSSPHNSSRPGPYQKGNRNTDTVANFKCFRSMSDFIVLSTETSSVFFDAKSTCNTGNITHILYALCCGVSGIPNCLLVCPGRDVSLTSAGAALMLVHGKNSVHNISLVSGRRTVTLPLPKCHEYSIRMLPPTPPLHTMC